MHRLGRGRDSCHPGGLVPAGAAGQVITTSEAYESSKASGIKAIESVKRNAPDAEIDDRPTGSLLS